MSIAPHQKTITLPVAGMDCASCAAHVEQAVGKLPGVAAVAVLVAAERATVTFNPAVVSPEQIKAAIGQAGYSVPDVPAGDRAALPQDGSVRISGPELSRVVGWGALSMVALVVLGAAVGEWLGFFDQAIAWLPWWVPAAAIALGGWPVLRGVVLAAFRRQVTSHTLMTAGVLAAIAVGEWTTAALIVFFMRFADWLEALTTARSRSAIQQILALQPAHARVVRDGSEFEIPVADVEPDQIVLVRPGERIPVDGVVVEGYAPVDQAPITGESIPADKHPGDTVFAATVAQAGFLRVRSTRRAEDTTFARILRLVEEAESHKAPVQRLADRFAAYYLPIVLSVALGTYLVTGRVLNAVAVLVVACACAIALATPVVVLASVGSAARRGLLIKGGSALEQLARVDTVLLDKTGTVTLGQPAVTDIIALDGVAEDKLLGAVAAVEARSEHPLARAMVLRAGESGVTWPDVQQWNVQPGRGVVGVVEGRTWAVGSDRLLVEQGVLIEAEVTERAAALAQDGKTVFFAACDKRVVGLVAVADTLRPEAATAVRELRRLGVRRMIMLTGDTQRTAAAIAAQLDVEYRAGLLPEDKIAVVTALQAEGAVVMMVGDGVNDAPALAQANVGVAMGAAGTDVAIEAADVALLRDDWHMIPVAIQLGRRARRTIRQNLGFTALYNLLGITLAAIGVLPPVWAAAAQSLPDVAIMLNSARLLRVEGKGQSDARHSASWVPNGT